jgi:hypothetical protein
MSFESFLKNISDNNILIYVNNFIIDISNFTSELSEDDYISLLEFIKEKYSSDIVLNEKQQNHFNESVLKETIIKEMEKNKTFEIALKKTFYLEEYGQETYALSLREFTEELTEYHFKRLLEHEGIHRIDELILNDQQKIQFNQSKYKDEINYVLAYNKARNHGEPCERYEPVTRKEEQWNFIPRKGEYVEVLSMLRNEIIDEEGEFAGYLRQKALEQSPKVLLFDLNKKTKNIKKKNQNQEKLFIDNQFSKLVDAWFIKDYYALKATEERLRKKKKTNFKKYNL